MSDSIRTAYREILGREADDAGLNHFIDAMNAGESLASIRSELAYSGEATADIGTIFQQVLGRSIDGGNLSAFQNLLAQGWAQTTVRANLSYTAEAAADIDSFYRQVAWRPATSDEIALFQNALSQGGDWNLGSVRWNIAHTDAAAAGINGIYQQMLGHPSYDPDLFAAYENNMGWGWTLGDVRWDLAHRPEATGVITTIYQQVLGRNPIGAEIAVYEDNVLAQGGTPGGIRTALATSPEAAANIGAAFRNEWGVEAQAGDYAYWENTLAQGSSIQAIRTAFAYAPQATNAIDGIYRQMLGHGSDDPGLLGAYEYNLANYNWTLADVRWDLAHRPEASNAIGSYFVQILGRTASATDIAWQEEAGLVQGLSLGNIRSNLAYTAEAAAGIDAIYRQTLGRGADTGGIGVYENLLAQGWSRSDVRYSLAYSGEAAADIDGIYRQVAWRGATPDEIGLFQNALSQGGDWNQGSLRWNIAHTGAVTDAINGIYQQMLGHPSNDPGLLAAYENNLGAAGWTLADVRWDLAHRPEATSVITTIYQQVLGRNPIGAEIAVYEDNVLAQGGTPGGIRTALATSSEAAANIGAAFRNEWGVEAQAGDYAYWENTLAQGSSIQAIRTAFAYAPQATNAIDGIYQQMLGHGSNDPGLLGAYEYNLANYNWTLGNVRWDLAHRPEVSGNIDAAFRRIFSRPAAQGDFDAYEGVIGNGWSMADAYWNMAHQPETSSTIATIYQQVLGRAPSGAEIAVYEDNALSHGASLSDVRYAVGASPDAAANIAADFRNELGREAQGGDFAYWEDALGRGTATFQSMRTTFSQLPEATAGLASLYQQVLGRPMDPYGESVWQNSLSQGASLNDIRYVFAYSAEAANGLNAAYQQILGRNPEPGAVAGGQDGLFHGDSQAAYRHRTATSVEAQNDIAADFRNELGREAQGGDFAYWEDALERGTATFQSMRTGFSQMPEATAGIASLYQQVLGRPLDPYGASVWQNSLSQGASLNDVRYALAHSAEAANGLTAAYQQILGRNPESGVVAAGQDGLFRGDTQDGYRQRIASSAESASNIASAFHNELGREATGNDLAYWEGQLAQGTSLSGIRSSFAHSAEANATLASIYQQVLGRGMNAADYDWSEDSNLAQGVGIEALRSAIAFSAEAGVAVSTMYRQQFGRDATAAEVAAGQAALAGGQSLVGLRQGLAAETVTPAVNAFYQGLFERDATTGELSSIAAALLAGQTLAQVLAGLRPGFAASNFTAAIANRFYQDLFERNALPTELANWQAALAAGQTEAGLKGALRPDYARSTYTAAIVDRFYQDLFDRDAFSWEVTTFQDGLAAGQSMAALKAFYRPIFAGSSYEAAQANALYQQLFGRDASPTEVTSFEDAIKNGQSLDQVRDFLRSNFAYGAYETALVSSAFQQVLGQGPSRTDVLDAEDALAAGVSLAQVRAAIAGGGVPIDHLYQEVLGRGVYADPAGLAGAEAALNSGLALGDVRWAAAHSAEAADRIDDIYWQDLGRGVDAGGKATYQDALGHGATLGDVRWAVAHSAEAQGQLQAAFANHLGRAAGADEVSGFERAMSLGDGAYGQFTVSSSTGTLASVDARTLLVELGTYVTVSGGLVPVLTGVDGQVYSFRNATELAGFALGLAVQQGVAGPAAWDTYALTVSWLAQIGQGLIQAAYVLQRASAASTAAGDAVSAYLQSIGAQMAMQVQALPPGQRHAVERDVPLGQYAAHVVVTGDLSDGSGEAGFAFQLRDTDPERTRLVNQAQEYADRAAAAQAAGNQLLAYLDNCQARVDVAYANLPPDARSDKMLSVAQRFVDAAFAAAAANNWNLVQTLETAADVSLQIAALPVDQRHRMTERFMHESVKHDITVNPDDADPYATFSDHSKGEDVIGAIVEAVIGVVINVLAVIPVTAPVFAPLAVAWDTAQAAKSFSEGNILGGVLSLASAAGVGLSGLAGAAAVNEVGSFASEANAFAGSLGFTTTTVGTTTTTAAQALGRTILSGVAVVGGTSGVVQSASNGDGIGIAAGLLEIAAGVAGGLVATGNLAPGVGNAIAAATGAASAGLSASDAFLHGNLASGLSISLNALLPQIAQAVLKDQQQATQKPETIDDHDEWSSGSHHEEDFNSGGEPKKVILPPGVSEQDVIVELAAMGITDFPGFKQLSWSQLAAGAARLGLTLRAFTGLLSTLALSGDTPDAAVRASVVGRDDLTAVVAGNSVLISKSVDLTGNGWIRFTIPGGTSLQLDQYTSLPGYGSLVDNSGNVLGVLFNGDQIYLSGDGILAMTGTAGSGSTPPNISPTDQTGSPTGPEDPDGNSPIQVSRPLETKDLGIKGDLQQFSGSLTVRGKTAYVDIQMIQGVIENPTSILPNLMRLGVSSGADTLVIRATIANEKLLTLMTRMGAITRNGVETLTIPLK